MTKPMPQMWVVGPEVSGKYEYLLYIEGVNYINGKGDGKVIPRNVMEAMKQINYPSGSLEWNAALLTLMIRSEDIGYVDYEPVQEITPLKELTRKK